MRLEGKVALITGGAGGIGRETALAFAAEGAGILVVDVNSEAGGETVSLVKEAGGEALYQDADVSKASDCEAMVAAATSAPVAWRIVVAAFPVRCNRQRQVRSGMTASGRTRSGAQTARSSTCLP